MFPARLPRLAILAAAALPAPALAIYPYTIFFGFGKSTLDPRGAYEMDQAVKGIVASGFRCLEIRAGADRAGSRAYNLALSRRRAETVRSFLVERGIPAEWITVRYSGENEPFVNTADGVPEANNRLAVIIPNCPSPPP